MPKDSQVRFSRKIHFSDNNKDNASDDDQLSTSSSTIDNEIASSIFLDNNGASSNQKMLLSMGMMKNSLGETNNSRSGYGRRLSWISASTLDINEPLLVLSQENDLMSEKFKLLLKPPQFDRDDLLYGVHTFLSSLAEYIPSVKLDTTYTVFKSVRHLLRSPDCVRLYGLLIHFAYWNVIHPAARSAIQRVKLQNLATRTFDDVDAMYDQANRLELPEALQYFEELKIPKDELATNKNYQQKFKLMRQSSQASLQQIDHLFQKELSKHIDVNDPHDQELYGDYLSVHNYGEENEGNELTLAHLNTTAEAISSCGGSITSEASLTGTEREQLFIQLETCIVTLFRKMGTSKFALVIGRQALISCCHYIVDEILAMVYPWFAVVSDADDPTEQLARSSSASAARRQRELQKQAAAQMNVAHVTVKELNLRLRRLVHQSISDLIDPARIYTSAMLLNAVLGFGSNKNITNVSRKAQNLLDGDKQASRRGKYYRTSAAVLALLGDSHSPQARRFLQRGAGTYSKLPGVIKPFDLKLDERPPNTDWDKLEGHEDYHYYDPALFAISSPIPNDDNNNHDALFYDRARSPSPDLMRTIMTPTKQNRTKSFFVNSNNKPFSQSQAPLQALSPPKPLTRTMTMNTTTTSCKSTKQTKLQPLDFGNLFANQPHAGYYPSIIDPSSPHPNNRPTTNNTIPFSSGKLMNFARTPTMKNLGEDSFTVETERSLVFNKQAEVPLSLKAKSALLGLMVDKTTKIYRNQIQTRQTALRISLLQGEDHLHNPTKKIESVKETKGWNS